VYKHLEPGIGAFYYADAGWWSQEGSGFKIFSAGKVDIRSAHRDQPTGFPVETLTRITFTAPDGTEYELRDQLTNGQPVSPVSGGFNRGTVFVTADGTTATFVSDWDIRDDPTFGQGFYDSYPDGYLMLRDGTRFRVDDGFISWMRDRNGNKVTFSPDFSRQVTTITDSLNRQITVSYPAQTTGVTEITYKGFGGAVRTIKIGQTNLANALRSGYSMQTIQQLFPELHGGGPVDSTVVNYIELPDGRSYQLRYNPYGELARVVLPTGGAIEYDYAAGLTNGAASGVFSVSDPLPNKYIYRRVIERRIYPDGGTGSSYESKITYSRPETTTSNLGYVITETRNNSGTLLAKSQHYFHGSPKASFSQKPTHYGAWKDGREYKTEIFDTNGSTVLRRAEQTFAQRAAVSWWGGSSDTAPPNDPRTTESVTTIEPSAANLVTKQTFGFDDAVPFNNQNNVKEYAFGSGAAGSLARETRTTFVTSSSYTTNAIHLRSLPSQISIHDGSGVERARASYEYDNYTTDSNHAALVNRSGISGFDSSFGTSYTTRGNVMNFGVC
jgi:YD repeat-containing protein